MSRQPTPRSETPTKRRDTIEKLKEIVDSLAENGVLSRSGFKFLLERHTPETDAYLFKRARAVREERYGRSVFVRGLIEFTNHCRNDCFYCGIRRGNLLAERYRLSMEQLLDCCEKGYDLGFRTFVLQGGEDGYFTDARMTNLIRIIKQKYPDCALTLSIGEKSRESYQAFFNAGADRYLLRHETASSWHYRALHPKELSLANRKQCLLHLKEIGYQVGCGFMVGSPFQTPDCLAEDLLFIGRLKPHMVGLGPFIPHRDTPFAGAKAGSLDLTLLLLAVVRLMLPDVLLPATTALATLHPHGREMGILAGANVVMPNLSPRDVRKKYALYDNKACTGDEAAESLSSLKESVERVGCKVVVSRGDHNSVH